MTYKFSNWCKNTLQTVEKTHIEQASDEEANTHKDRKSL
jgi:hypothetical protein